DDALHDSPPASTVPLSWLSGLRSLITQRSSPPGAIDPSDPGTIEPRAMGTRCPAFTTQGPRPKDQAPAARGMRTQHPAPSTHDPRTRPQGETGVSHRCRGGLAR